MVQGFKTIWESLNAGTNLLAVGIILAGGVIILRGHAAEGSAMMTGGFTLLNNSKKVEPAQAPADHK
jgi:hypothetical protein